VSNYDSIKIWDIENGKEPLNLANNSSLVNLVAYNPLALLNLDDIAPTLPPQSPSNFSYWVNSVAYSPDGRYLASGGRALLTQGEQSVNIIKIWDLEKGKELFPITVNSRHIVNSVAYSPDGRYLASGSRDKTIKIWEVATGKELRTLTGHSDWVRSVVYSPDGRYLASGSDDNTIKIWEVAMGKQLRTLAGHSDIVFSVAYSPDGRYLASGSGDKTIKIWRVGQ
jgi:WD40 repeat protein